jgi:urease accessory protein
VPLSTSTRASALLPYPSATRPRDRDVPVAGRGVIAVERAGDRSVVRRAYATSPLRLLTPTNHGHAAWIFLSTFGGGMVDGDRVDLSIGVSPGASAYVSTQASTKIYRSPRGTRAETRAHVAAGGALVFVPDPVVCFAGARYHQEQHVDLEDDASLALVDWVTSGRRASGERWHFDRYAGRTTVRRNGRPLVHESLLLDQAQGPLAARMGRVDVLAVAIVTGGRFGATATAMLERVAAMRVSRGSAMLVAAAPLEPDGCVLRVAGQSVEQVGHVLRDHMRDVSAWLGDDPWRRKW